MDLFALVADKNIQYSLEGALGRPQALGIRAITKQILTHSGRDGGARTTGADVMGLQRGKHAAFLLIFDFEGCGCTEPNALALEARLDQELMQQVGPNSKSIVIEPESDIWIWGSDNVLADVFDWTSEISIRRWLTDQGFEFGVDQKPLRPKEALEALARIQRKPRSSALYKEVTSKISLRRCVDPAFLRLSQTLKQWFP